MASSSPIPADPSRGAATGRAASRGARPGAPAPDRDAGGASVPANGVRNAVTLGDAVVFFLPLIFMTELNMISKSVIHAFLARLPDPELVLAAFSVSFAFYYTVTSSTEVNTLLSISYLKDRRAVRHLLGFFCIIVGPPVLVALAVAFTPLGVWVYGGVFGASAEVIEQAQRATFYFALSAPVLMFRAQAFALIMVNRRTLWITASTLLRLISLAGSLVVLPHLLPGASVGAAALVTCMVVEAGFAWWAARNFYRALPADAGPQPSYRELWGFSWPLMMSQTMEMGIVMTINIFLGRLGNADLALASFGVVHGLANLVLSPMRNLAQTAQTLVHTRADLRVLMEFTGWLVVIFTAGITVIFLTPIRGWVLGTVMGLKGDLFAYSEPAIVLTWLVAGFWAYGALFRGLLAAARRTGTVAVSAVSRLAVVVLVGASTLVLDHVNGALVGILAWAATFAVESGILGLRLLDRRTGRPPLFPESPEARGS